MNRLLEILLGLDRGFLARRGDFALTFDPKWPWSNVLGNAVWNVLLVAAAVALVVYVYRREGGRSRGVRVGLGILRALLLAFLIALLNRPSLTLTQSRTEPSVLAILVDDSVSMRVKDAGPDAAPEQRLAAVQSLLDGDGAALLAKLADRHAVKLYRFDADAAPLAQIAQTDPNAPPAAPATQPATGGVGGGAAAIAKIDPSGQTTQLGRSIRTVMEELQGQRVAGVVVLTDGRDVPAAPGAEASAAVVDYGVKVYPIPVGSGNPPRNVAIQAVAAPDGAFVGDIVNVKVTLRATGYGDGRAVTLSLKNKATGEVLPDGSGGVVRKEVETADGQPTEAELQFKPAAVGTLDLEVVADPLPAELDEQDNVRAVQISVLDAQTKVLFVDGYPRWDFRFLKTELIRDKTVTVSTLLTSADPAYPQEGNLPITRFPESIEELLEYDVVILGDVDPRQFTDNQLQLIADFVGERAGGLCMVSGPRFSPQAYRNTPIELLLPVQIGQAENEPTGGTIAEGFRPVVTPAGAESGIFRFLPDPARNAEYLKTSLPPLFWFQQGVTVKPGVGEALAVHPKALGPDGRPAPILVAGRYGAGRTIFSAVDDSWRWRYYTGEGVFDTYWVQQVRYLTRSKKLGQRKFTFTVDRPAHELGEQVTLTLRVLDPQLLRELPARIDVKLVDDKGAPVRTVSLTRQPAKQATGVDAPAPPAAPAGPNAADTYTGTFSADRVGRFTAKLPPVASGVEAFDLPIDVQVPRLELAQPQVDTTALARLAAETHGEVIPLADARAKLEAIPSAEVRIPVRSAAPLWDAPLAMVIFIFLISAEWISRKVFGML